MATFPIARLYHSPLLLIPPALSSTRLGMEARCSSKGCVWISDILNSCQPCMRQRGVLCFRHRLDI